MDHGPPRCIRLIPVEEREGQMCPWDQFCYSTVVVDDGCYPNGKVRTSSREGSWSRPPPVKRHQHNTAGKTPKPKSTYCMAKPPRFPA